MTAKNNFTKYVQKTEFEYYQPLEKACGYLKELKSVFNFNEKQNSSGLITVDEYVSHLNKEEYKFFL